MRSVKVKVSADVTGVETSMRTGGAAVRGFGRDVDRTARKASADLDEITHHAKVLDRQLKDVERDLASLAKGFANTGDTAILKAIAERKAMQSQLKNVRSLLPDPQDLLPDPRVQGRRFGRDLMSSVAESVSSSGPVVAAAVLGVGLAPALGAAVAAAVVGGAGTAGVIGGLVLASKDPRVAAAGKGLGQELLGALKQDSAVFVEPALAGIRTVRAGFHDMEPDLRRIFQASAGFVDPLVQGALKGAKSITAGVADAVEAADPVMQAFGRSFEKIGTSIGDVFTTLAPDARTGALAIDDVTNSVTRFVEVTAKVAHGLAVIRGGTDGTGGLEGVDRMFDKARYWVEDSSQLSDVLSHLGISLDITGDGFKKNSAEGEAYRRMTLGTASAQDLQLLSTKGVQEATDLLGGSQNAVGQSTGAMTTLQQLLNGSLQDGIAAAGGFAEALALLNGGALSAEQAEIAFQEAIDNVTAAVKQNGHTLDADTKKGRENRTALLSVAQAAQTRAQAIYDQTTATKGQAAAEAAGARAIEAGRKQLIASYLQFDNNKARARAYANSILQIPTSWQTKITAETRAALAKVEALGFKVTQLPDGSFVVNAATKEAQAKLKALGITTRTLPDGTVVVVAKTAAAKSRIAEAQQILNNLNGKTAVTYIVTKRIEELSRRTVSAAQSAYEQTKRDLRRTRAAGGIDSPLAMADGGVTQAGIYPASNPPLVRFAEPETGGEGYVPKNGDRRRNLAIMNEMASWPSVNAQIIPMARGGIAAAGLVNVAPHDTPAPALVRRGSRLDSVEAYIAARNAVASLNASLKEHGRSLSLSTKRGRENRAELNAAIRAAQDAATAKYEETGSVRQANLEYDRHIGRLRAVLAQQKVNATTRHNLISRYARRPVYDVPEPAEPPPPKNSSNTVSFVQAQIGAEQALGQARGFFDKSWGKPTFAVRTATGRDNLAALLDFLAAAGGAAQARYTQTGSARLAGHLYAGYLRQLRGMLADTGLSRKQIDALVRQYGRITLGNRWGGVYQHAQSGLLQQAHIAAGGPTRYAYAEAATGGELFAPKRGDLAKTRTEVGWAVRNWWGGDVRWQGNRSSGSASTNKPLIINATIPIQLGADTIVRTVRLEVDAVMGTVADAQVYATAG